MVIKNAKYLILSNSSFAWFPAWTSEKLKYCIAPKYWGRHNISDGYWSLGYNLTNGWMYQDRKGKLYTYDECHKELQEYMRENQSLYSGTIIYKKSIYTRIKNFFHLIHTLNSDFSITHTLTHIISVSAIQYARKIKLEIDKIIKKRAVTGIIPVDELSIFNILKEDIETAVNHNDSYKLLREKSGRQDIRLEILK